MVSTYRSGLNTKEDLMHFIKYSVPIYVKNEEDEVEESISDLVKDNDPKTENDKDRSDNDSLQPGNAGNTDYQIPPSTYPPLDATTGEQTSHHWSNGGADVPNTRMDDIGSRCR